MEDYSNIKSRGVQMFYIQLVFLIIAGLFVLLRVYVRAVLVKKVTLDDWLIFLAMLIYLVYGAVALDGIRNGATGKSLAELKIDDAAVSLRAWYICEVLYAPTTLAIRASVCVLLLRLASNKIHRWIIWINLAVVSVVSIAFFFLLVFQCSPVHFFWRQLYGIQGTCIDRNIVPYATIAHSVISALSDWCLGLLPIALLWNVDINRRTKVIIAILLSMGMVAGIALIVRIPFVRHMDISMEFLYATIDVAIWSIMEPALGIIAACTATFRPLFKNWGFGWTSRRGPRNDNVHSPDQKGTELSSTTHTVSKHLSQLGPSGESQMELNNSGSTVSTPSSPRDIESGQIRIRSPSPTYRAYSPDGPRESGEGHPDMPAPPAARRQGASAIYSEQV
ncbi:hypothetical protein BJF96_g8484 [Verticillium dahliae]|uniref:Rhodopsin domain-containing protein n=1 Tax=Verticillium dahliae TaxID=27337 RepID=A0AA44WES3_VERDA|nr:Tyrosine-protein phosphatase yvh1 [Verticillium dahliae VDG2]PNH28182.1 hypothetical protein BJF96_g8484 [Verticillium dahliae]